MRMRGAVGGWKTLSRFALIGMIGSGAAACSTDASRLSEPFSNPFSSLTGEPSATGSLGEGDQAIQTATPAIRTSRIQSQSLAAPGAATSPRATATAALAQPPVGGMNPSGLNPDGGRTPKAQAMTPRAVPAAPAKPAEKKAVEAKKAPEPQKAVKVDHKKAEAAKKAEAESKLARADASKSAAKKVAEAKAAEAAAKASSKETKVAAKETKVVPKETKVAAKDISAPKPAPAPEPTTTSSAAASNDSFRWPAKGRVINGYGSSGNEGINIAVPEGTPVKAAEEGTVAYAGSDVKGYGKLVLVRHSNGYVSAYAHNGELDVKPGEKVKRGQVIAKSGATGNVTSPQLHFEIRKGATPVDPIPHLASN